MNRSQMLAQFYGGGYGGLQNLYGQLGSEARGRADQTRQYQRDVSLAKYYYDRDENRYQDYLNRQSGQAKMGFFGGLGGAAIGAGIGGLALGTGFPGALGLGPYGMLAGGLLGSRIGSGLGSLR